MAKITSKHIDHIFNNLSMRNNNGSINLYDLMKTIERLIMKLVPKEAQKFRKEYMKDKYSVGGLKPLPIPKRIKQLYKYLGISYDPSKELYFKGHQNRKGSGKKLGYKDLPKILVKSRTFIQDNFDV